MKNYFFIFLSIFMCSLYAQTDWEVYKTAKHKATYIVASLETSNFKKLHSYLSTDLKEKLTVDKLEETFSQLEEKYGKLNSQLEFAEKITAEDIYYEQGIQFENEKMDILFALNESNEISTFRILPYSNKMEWQIPSYANLAQFEEYDIKIGTEIPLLGKVCRANRPEELVVVVFVHGSGPNDMDESLGPNKIFKDLAYGLASNNIASIRYNKRTYDYKKTLSKRANKLTIDEIVTNDAVNAIEKARDMGAEKVILLGHSLGGYMAPKIATRAKVDGVILMAGPVSPLEDLILEQLEYLMKNDSTASINEIQYNQIKWQVKNLKKGDYDSTTAGPMLPLGLPGSFWISLNDYEPQKIASEQVETPYLVLNGGRDYQVTLKEANKWKNGTKNEKSKTIIYPKLNHLFYAGDGILLPEEYEKVGHLDENVLNDMIEWINAL